jgi:hypothetical protein
LQEDQNLPRYVSRRFERERPTPGIQGWAVNPLPCSDHDSLTNLYFLVGRIRIVAPFRIVTVQGDQEEEGLDTGVSSWSFMLLLFYILPIPHP